MTGMTIPRHKDLGSSTSPSVDSNSKRPLHPERPVLNSWRSLLESRRDDRFLAVVLLRELCFLAVQSNAASIVGIRAPNFG
jgi:hypothetical protein